MGKFSIRAFMNQGDAVMPRDQARPNDIVIPVMGPTGVGKSSFINNVTGEKENPANVSDGFASCTSHLAHYFVEIPQDLKQLHGLPGDSRLVMVDTPGFDDTNISDSEILRRIAVWLASSYDADMKVGGVIYMFPIYPNRLTRNDRSNLKVFERICGKGGLSKVILASTRWDICPPGTGESREQELRTNFWKNMIDPTSPDRKAEMARLLNNRGSAWNIIKLILSRYMNTQTDGVILDLQDQIVRRRRELRETPAAQELRRKLEELLKESGSSSSQDRRSRLDALLKQAEDLKLSLPKRFKNWIDRLFS